MASLKKRVNIELSSIVDGHKTSQKLSGLMFEKSNLFYLRYEEHSEEVKIVTILKWAKEDKTLQVTRQGEASATMVFEQGKWTHGTYHTPYGSFQLKIHTKQLQLPERMESTILRWTYDMYMNGERSGHFIMEISYSVVA